MAKKSPVLTSYVALRTIRHDGDYYNAGDTIELSDNDAAALLAIKAVEPAPSKAIPAKTPPSTDDVNSGQNDGQQGDGAQAEGVQGGAN